MPRNYLNKSTNYRHGKYCATYSRKFDRFHIGANTDWFLFYYPARPFEFQYYFYDVKFVSQLTLDPDFVQLIHSLDEMRKFFLKKVTIDIDKK